MPQFAFLPFSYYVESEMQANRRSSNVPQTGDTGILKKLRQRTVMLTDLDGLLVNSKHFNQVFVQRTDPEWIHSTVNRIFRSKLHLRRLIQVLIKFIMSESHPEWARHALIWFHHLIASHGHQIRRSWQLLQACQPLVAHATKITGLQALYQDGERRGRNLERRAKALLHKSSGSSSQLFYDEKRQIASTGYVFVDDSDGELGRKARRSTKDGSRRQPGDGRLLSGLDSVDDESLLVDCREYCRQQQHGQDDDSDGEEGSSWLLESDDDDDDLYQAETGSDSDSDLDNLDMLSPLAPAVRSDPSDLEVGDEEEAGAAGWSDNGTVSDDGVFDVHSETTTLSSEEEAGGSATRGEDELAPISSSADGESNAAPRGHSSSSEQNCSQADQHQHRVSPADSRPPPVSATPPTDSSRRQLRSRAEVAVSRSTGPSARLSARGGEKRGKRKRADLDRRSL